MGDHQTAAARERYVHHIDDMQSLYGFDATQLVHDAHPHYFSTEWAAATTLHRLGVQHHHAHVVAGMLEHRWLDRTVMGVAWDGTGYGADGTIWGGEFLETRADAFVRVGHLRPFPLPGADAAVRQPWRVALAILAAAVPGSDATTQQVLGISHSDWRSVSKIAARPAFSPTTTSAGRLFDAAAALILGIRDADYEGQPAMRLEAIADREARGAYHFPLRDGPTFQLDWRPLFRDLWTDTWRGTSASTLSMRFHRSLAEAIVHACRRRAELPVVLAGGVFQNRLLVELIWELMSADESRLALPGVIPVNDGGLAAGQLAIAAATENA